MTIVKWYDEHTVLWTGTADDMKSAVTQAVASGANLGGADLRGADLRGANLRGANLGGADLRGADLCDADLCDANLCGADLCSATLGGANLRGANLCDADLCSATLGGADLRGANLRGANLRGANLCSATLGGADLRSAKNVRLPTGETWDQYLAETVPALLTAGGQSLESFADHFVCHTWENCPMAHAFGAHDLSGVPLLLRPRAEQFIQFFDAGQIPWPLPVALPTSQDPA